MANVPRTRRRALVTARSPTDPPDCEYIPMALPRWIGHGSLRSMRTLSLVLLILTGCRSVSAQQHVAVITANGMSFAARWTDAGKDAPVALFFPMCWATPPETWAPVAAALKARGVSALVTTYPGSLGNSFAGAHTPRHVEYVRSGRVPVLGLTSRGEGEWVTQHGLLVKASGAAASRVIVRDEAGHGTVLLKERAFAMEVAAWIADRLFGR